MSQNFEELLGPKGKSDYQEGDTISYLVNGVKHTGKIIHISAPGQTVTGKQHPTEYWVSSGGFPDVVYSGDILQEA